MMRRDSGDPDLVLEELRTHDLCLRFLPGVGGRLISLEVAGVELLWRNPEYLDDDLRSRRPMREWTPVDGTFATWANVGGSKTWPAPQGWGGAEQWAGPPDAVLDSGEWSSSWAPGDLGGHRYRLESPPDPRTGLTIRRVFDVPGSGTAFSQRIELVNSSTATIRWSPWEVCQIDIETGAEDPRARIVVATDGTKAPVRLGDYAGRIGWSPETGGIAIPVQDVVGKLGFPDADGWIGWWGPDGEGITLRFDAIENAQYPDQGSRAEVWMQCPVREPIAALSGLHPRGRLAELEVLGPLRTIAPGGTSAFTIAWEARPPTSRHAG